MPKFLGEIVQNGGDFALLDSSNVRGGFMQVDTLQDRDNIIPDKLKKGMHCYVEEEEQIFEWKGDQWVLFKISSDDIASVRLLTVSQKVRELTEPILDEDGEPQYFGIRFDGDVLFRAGDIIGWDISSNSDGDITGQYTEISYVRDNVAYIYRTVDNYLPDKYDTVYLMGSASDTVRRCVNIIHPYHGAMVLSQFLNISIDNINTNYTFRLGQHGINRWKVYGEDVYFKGTFIDEQGRNLSDLVTLNQETIDTGLTGLRREFGYENLLNNPYFIGGMDCWLTKNTATYFKAGGKFIMTNKTLLSAKRDGAYVIIENGQAVLRLVNGFILQKNENLKKITDLDHTEPPYYVTLIFNYKPITAGTLKVVIRYKDGDGIKYQYTKAQQDLVPSNEYATWKSTFLWDGLGDFTVEYNGEVKIQTFVLKMNDVKNLELRYQRLFELSPTLIEMAEKYLEQSK